MNLSPSKKHKIHKIMPKIRAYFSVQLIIIFAIVQLKCEFEKGNVCSKKQRFWSKWWFIFQLPGFVQL